MTLIDAFDIGRGDIISLVGAGGKTTLMYALGREAENRGWRAVLTTTTRIYPPEKDKDLTLICESAGAVLDKAGMVPEEIKQIVVAGGDAGYGKLSGLKPEIVEELLLKGYDIVIVEADGSAGRPFKAPGNAEPVIPFGSKLVIPVIGIDCIGKTLSAEYVHRPEMVAEITGSREGDIINSGTVAGVLLDDKGYRKNVPPKSRWIPFINKVNEGERLQVAIEISGILGKSGVKKVVIGAAGEPHPVKEVMVY
ncbi:MAG: selenium cofactor biosynthesis protein YqeC [Bacillota bacterium]